MIMQIINVVKASGRTTPLLIIVMLIFCSCKTPVYIDAEKNAKIDSLLKRYEYMKIDTLIHIASSVGVDLSAYNYEVNTEDLSGSTSEYYYESEKKITRMVVWLCHGVDTAALTKSVLKFPGTHHYHEGYMNAIRQQNISSIQLYTVDNTSMDTCRRKYKFSCDIVPAP